MASDHLKKATDAPVTVGTIVLAVAVFGLELSGFDPAPLHINPLAFWAEPWRAFTSSFVHIGLIHLAFNLYWIWLFGIQLEPYLGSAKTLAATAFIAFTSACLEYGLLDGGVGLSGVVYGHFGLIWVLQHGDPAFEATLTGKTKRLFVGWFFLCILLTVTEIFPIGNVAHGAGWLAGTLFGFVWAGTSASNQHWAVLRNSAGVSLVVLFIVSLASASVLRPALNFSDMAGNDSVNLGVEAQERGALEDASRHYERAIALREDNAHAWYNLAGTRTQQGEHEEAVSFYERALELDQSSLFASGLAHGLGAFASAEVDAGRVTDAVPLLERAVALDDGEFWLWTNLAAAYAASGDPESASSATQRADELEAAE